MGCWPTHSGSSRACCAATARTPSRRRGRRAAEITAPHPVDIPHGLDSPVGRVYESDGQVLLLGVGQDANTTIHLAENMAGVRYRRKKHLMVLRDGRSTPGLRRDRPLLQNFSLVDGWLDVGLQRRGTVGRGSTPDPLAGYREYSRRTAARQQRNNLLHPFGVDEECDEARANAHITVCRGLIKREPNDPTQNSTKPSNT